ncbi:acyltransferase family protein [Puniceibacterium sediminis]|uniref:Acyltransferase family protein n=1 Tax=Puniceibacterium sediminis TaxID=1608407 RepID=A0A238YNV7_9RHOB|nr:acyltransferase [Puniceibacterium sediminis]SNR72099.1 Acyltransferase family protein [Puniceibacterium sediminis]
MHPARAVRRAAQTLQRAGAIGRNTSLEYARLLAACGIVVFHTGAPGAAVGYAALPFFLIVLVVLAAPTAARQGFGDYARGRANRLLKPWLAWSALYGGLKLAELAVTGAPLQSEFAPRMILTGPALHLWFLPFAFVACLLVHPLIRLSAQATAQGMAQDRHSARADLLSAALAALALGFLALRQGQVFPAPLAQWLYAMPPVCLGLAFMLTGNRPGRMAALLTGFFALALGAGWTSGCLQIALAAGVFALCIALPNRPGAQPGRPGALHSRLGGAAMGIYLAHPMVLSILHRTTDIAPDSLTMAALGCLGAFAISALIHHILTVLHSALATRNLRQTPLRVSAHHNTTA